MDPGVAQLPFGTCSERVDAGQVEHGVRAHNRDSKRRIQQPLHARMMGVNNGDRLINLPTLDLQVVEIIRADYRSVWCSRGFGPRVMS